MICSVPKGVSGGASINGLITLSEIRQSAMALCHINVMALKVCALKGVGCSISSEYVRRYIVVTLNLAPILHVWVLFPYYVIR